MRNGVSKHDIMDWNQDRIPNVGLRSKLQKVCILITTVGVTTLTLKLLTAQCHPVALSYPDLNHFAFIRAPM